MEKPEGGRHLQLRVSVADGRPWRLVAELLSGKACCSPGT